MIIALCSFVIDRDNPYGLPVNLFPLKSLLDFTSSISLNILSLFSVIFFYQFSYRNILYYILNTIMARLRFGL
jgi:hypothetical protein